MQPGYIIRPAVEAELPALGDFYVSQMRQAFLHRQRIGALDYFPTQRFVDDCHLLRRKVFDSPLAITLVAERSLDGAIVGAVEFGPRRSYADLDGRCQTRWEIYSLYASEETRGTRLGSNLVAASLHFVLGRDARYSPFEDQEHYMAPGDECVVLTLGANSARAFYEKLGGVLKWECPNYLTGGTKVDVVAYELSWPALERLAASACAAVAT